MNDISILLGECRSIDHNLKFSLICCFNLQGQQEVAEFYNQEMENENLAGFLSTWSHICDHSLKAVNYLCRISNRTIVRKSLTRAFHQYAEYGCVYMLTKKMSCVMVPILGGGGSGFVISSLIFSVKVKSGIRQQFSSDSDWYWWCSIQNGDESTSKMISLKRTQRFISSLLWNRWLCW